MDGRERIAGAPWEAAGGATGKERTMKASVGDRIVVRGHQVGEQERDGEILEVHGPDGGPPYLVKWTADGHVGLVFPGSDVTIEHYESDLSKG
jgi:hypothetical protein